MKTTININGLPVEFTDQKPNKPCACWRIKQVGNVTYGPELTWVEYGLKTGKLIDNGSNKAPYIDELYNEGWRFSAPLVPVTVVDAERIRLDGLIKEAHRALGEAIKHAEDIAAGRRDDTNLLEVFFILGREIESNARKVVEGVR